MFSIVNSMFGDEQKLLLADQIQAGVMLRFNKRVVGRVDRRCAKVGSSVPRPFLAKISTCVCVNISFIVHDFH